MTTLRKMANAALDLLFPPKCAGCGREGAYLCDTGLVSMRRDGTKRLYKTRPEGLEEVRAFLDQFWGRSLDLLKQAAEQEQQGQTID